MLSILDPTGIAQHTYITSPAVHRAAFMQCVRRCAWSLFSDPEGPGENVCLDLQGSALPNPWGDMVYSASTQQTNSGKCVNLFKFSSSVDVEGASCSTALKVSRRETTPPKKLLSASQGEGTALLLAQTKRRGS